MESADRESRRLDILSVKKEANLSAREVGEVEGRTLLRSTLGTKRPRAQPCWGYVREGVAPSKMARG